MCFKPPPPSPSFHEKFCYYRGEGLETNRSPEPKILVRKDSHSRKIRQNKTKVGHKKGRGGKWAYSVAADIGPKRANKEERGLCREGVFHSRNPPIVGKPVYHEKLQPFTKRVKFFVSSNLGVQLRKRKTALVDGKKNTFSFEFSIFSYLAQQCDSPLPSVLT